MNFINFSELAGFVDAAFAETEIIAATSSGTKTTTIYAGSPFRKSVNDTPPFAANANGDLLQDGGDTTTVLTWKIRRTMVVEDAEKTIVTQQWAEGAWADRASLTYQYLQS